MRSEWLLIGRGLHVTGVMRQRQFVFHLFADTTKTGHLDRSLFGNSMSVDLVLNPHQAFQ